jgi:hypothetical protein
MVERARLALAASVAALAVGLLLLAPGPASAETGITEWSASVSTAQAGGHPDLDFNTEWKTHVMGESVPCHCDDARVVIQHFPTGFIGNTHAIATCTAAQLSTNHCPVESQLGDSDVGLGYTPLYNMETAPDQAGLIAFVVPLVASPALIDLSARTESDYGLDATSAPIFHVLAIPGVKLHLWGVPADHSHDPARFFSPLEGFGSCFNTYPGPCANVTGAQSSLPPIPYLENPTQCGVPLITTVDVQYYSGVSLTAAAPWPSTTGCDQLAFNPSLTATPTTTQQPGQPNGTVQADSASGLDVDLTVPQTQSPSTPSPSEIRATSVSLPEGFSINPNAADGKVTCSDQQGAFGTREGASCPEHSKVGTVELDSSALPQPIPGAIYLGDPQPGNKYRIFLTADGFGTHVKLAGSVEPNPQTGQIKVSFPELPQSPFQEFNLHFFGSERGLLATPTQCGTYPVETEFVPWDENLTTRRSSSFFTVTSGPNGEPCPGAVRPFAPAVTAGTTNNTAGRYAPFVLAVNRDDGNQDLTAVNVSTPPGFLASLRGIPYCPESALATLGNPGYSGRSELASPACPAASQIGTASTSEGAGTHPLFTPGRVYLAGPYKGGPLSLVVVVPAVSGPYDLGNVVVRAAIHVDPATAKISTVSDPIPTILEGIPLRLRSIQINLNRPNFTLNPTNCDPFSVDTLAFGDQGSTSMVPSHFQVSSCPNLDFAPRLGLKLTGSTKRRGHPALTATLTTAPGEANIRRAVVTMPKTELLENAHIRTTCTRVQYSQHACPSDSIYGQATAVTPLLDKPLSGPVYLRASGNRLPDLVADLKGQIELELDGKIDTAKKAGLRARFNTVPDAPVSSFVLELDGGQKGLLINSANLCKAKPKAAVKLVGQNGAQSDGPQKLQTSCGSAASKHKRKTKRAGRR